MTIVEPTLRVLLVESDRPYGERLAAAFRRASVDVRPAASAELAIRLVAARRPDLVIANLSLCDASGWLLTAKLRLIDDRLRIWLYGSQASSYHDHGRDFLRVERMFYFARDHWEQAVALSRQIARDRAERSSSGDDLVRSANIRPVA